MFKSMTIYQLTQATAAIEERLIDVLSSKKRPFRACKPAESSYSGFVKPLGPDSTARYYETDGAILFCLRTDEKALPAAAVREQVNELVRAKEKEQEGEPLNVTEQRLIREDVIAEMLPHAIPAPSWTYAYLDKSLAMLFIGANDKGADAFMDELKKAIDGTPFVTLCLVDADPCDLYTEWLKDPAQLGDALNLGHACSLKQAKENGTAVVNINHEDLHAEDLQAMLAAGKQCCRIALEHDAVNFAITSKLGLRNVSFSDSSRRELDELEDGIPTTQRANEFAMYVTSIRAIMAELESLFDGWPKQEFLDLKRKA